MLEFPAALIALRGGQFASIQSNHELVREQSPPREQLHHLIEEALHLLLAEFADVVGQTLGGEWPLLLFGLALRIPAFGQPVCALLGIEAHQLHQPQVAKQHVR